MTYYEILKVPRNSSQSDIKKAYRREIFHWHPDRNSSPEARKRTEEIIEAYEILNDTLKREKYDQTLIYSTSIYSTSTSSEIFEEVRRWKKQAEYDAHKTAQKDLIDLLKESGVGFTKWFTGLIIGLIYMGLIIGGVLWITRKTGGFNGQYTGWVFLVSFLFLWIGIMVFDSYLKKRIFATKCEWCNKKVNNYYVCDGCGEMGCFACIGVPVDINTMHEKDVLYRCTKCNSKLNYVESKYAKYEAWFR